MTDIKRKRTVDGFHDKKGSHVVYGVEILKERGQFGMRRRQWHNAMRKHKCKSSVNTAWYLKRRGLLVSDSKVLL